MTGMRFRFFPFMTIVCFLLGHVYIFSASNAANVSSAALRCPPTYSSTRTLGRTRANIVASAFTKSQT